MSGGVSAKDGCSEPALEAARETLAEALLHTREPPGELGEALATAATDAFTSALSATVHSRLKRRRSSTVDRTWSSGHPPVRREQGRLRRARGRVRSLSESSSDTLDLNAV
ncbi:hypothetical protein B005_4936 [Nocardiopsis alba ATCC BAA-2165]|uniref:Uncharacterized protein n=1 Tax=Nocardiopsis alba (strain ATCC BAA-2165 / BE74) TaxID=1205910 RepID=J7LBM5_NOCAA|nr:hypothetical protein B005_4936 [Nocardiopsis alba ATCC BAA-2165]